MGFRGGFAWVSLDSDRKQPGGRCDCARWAQSAAYLSPAPRNIQVIARRPRMNMGLAIGRRSEAVRLPHPRAWQVWSIECGRNATGVRPPDG